MANLNPDPWLPADAPPLWGGAAVEVFRVESSGPTDPAVTGLTALPSVECLAVQAREGPDPGSALFRYRFGDGNAQSPQTADQAVSTAWTKAMLPQLVEAGDRLAVRATRPDGTHVWLFDGFPLDWGLSLSAGSEDVTMDATGVAKRLWDRPLGGAVWRDNDDPETVSDVTTALVGQFNPRGKPNASPSTADSGADPLKYPVFMDPDRTGEDASSNAYPRTWSLPMAVAYLLATGNGGGPWVANPSRSDLDALLVAREPIDGTPFDPTDASTYTAKPIAAKDDPFVGKVVPTLVHDQVADYGFGMRFPLTADGSGYPATALDLFLKQAGTVKSVYLAARLSPFDAGSNNVASAHLSRDLAGVVNQWAVDGAPDRYEVSVVLAPAFPSQTSDSATAAALAAFDASDPAFATGDGHDKYRTFVLDEDGSGHYANTSNAEVEGTATSLDDVLGAPASDGHGGTVPQYVRRRRPPVGTLFSKDTEGKPLRARLSISTDYAGTTVPGLWDGTGHWQHVEGGWELLKDRVGVRINVQHPNAWDVGKSQDADAPYKDGKVNVVEAINGTKTPFFLRLTCVIEGDRALTAVASRQDTSPVAAVVERRVDARDRYAVETVTAKSEFNNASGATDTRVRDDTDLATAEATAARTASEAGVFEGEVEIPFLTAYYQVGDRVDRVNGRDLGLRTDTGGTGYAPVYPSVVAVRWELAPGQRTFLTLSDAGLDRRRYGRRRRRSPGLPVVGDFGAPARPADPFAPKGALA